MKISEIIQKGQQIKRKSDGKIGVVAFFNANSRDFNTGSRNTGEWAFIDVEGEPERALINNMDEWELLQQTIPLTSDKTKTVPLTSTPMQQPKTEWEEEDSPDKNHYLKQIAHHLKDISGHLENIADVKLREFNSK